MNPSDAQAWLNRYIAAWRSNEPELIKALFTDEAAYSFRPWRSDTATVRGHQAIVEAWLEEDDAPGSWEASYEPFAIEGDRVVATGWSDYPGRDGGRGKKYFNCFLLQFAPDGRCAEFTEYWMQEPATATEESS